MLCSAEWRKFALVFLDRRSLLYAGDVLAAVWRFYKLGGYAVVGAMTWPCY